ncbi:hypothetical protein ACH5RR_039829 [Cinchona calisaya]|uniref:Uncharacterized protein n=1 Tax=Cinchona calisaya TaxID=153742 RepID=A0ABD2XZF0_9GENT
MDPRIQEEPKTKEVPIPSSLVRVRLTGLERCRLHDLFFWGCLDNDTSVCSNSKRSKKKKEFAPLHVTFEEQKAKNENLKRMKIDLNLQTSGETSHAKEVAVANQCNEMEASTNHHTHSVLPRHDNAVQDHGFGSSGSSCRGVEKEVDTQKRRRWTEVDEVLELYCCGGGHCQLVGQVSESEVLVLEAKR